MRYNIPYLLLLYVCDVAWRGSASTTETPTLGCYEDLQGGNYPSARHNEGDTWKFHKFVRNCTSSYNHLALMSINWGDWAEPVPSAAAVRTRVARGMGEFRRSIFEFVLDYTKWQELCRVGQSAIKCLNDHHSHCTESFGPWLFREGEFYIFGQQSEILETEILRPFPSRTCDGSMVKSSLQKILDEQPTTDCIDRGDITSQCLDPWMDELFEEYSPSSIYDPIQRQYWENLSAAMLRCAMDLLAASSCSKTQQELYYQVTKVLLPWTVNVDELDPNNADEIDFSDFQRCTVGVYGDPHIRLCDAASLITCGSPGRQTYYRNSMIEIFGVNTPVQSSQATTVTNIEINFYSSSDTSSLMAQYQAGNSQLPSTFVDGQAAAGTFPDQVFIVEVLQNYRVDLYYLPLGVMIKMRRSRGNYFFTMRAANNLFESGSGLLVNGCPPSQRLDIARGRRRRQAVTGSDCENACQTVKDTEFYDACVFDCTTVESVDITSMTREAVEMEEQVKLNDTELRRTAITVKFEGIGLNPGDDMTSETTKLTSRRSSATTDRITDHTSTTTSAITDDTTDGTSSTTSGGAARHKASAYSTSLLIVAIAMVVSQYCCLFT